MIGVQSKREDGVKQKKRRTRSHVSRWLMLGIICLGLVGGLLGTYQFAMERYRQYLTLAQQGEQHLRAAQSVLEVLMHNPFDTVALAHAQHEFAAAEGDFAILNGVVQHIPSFSSHLPMYGVKLQAVRELVPLALHFSQVGVSGCRMFSVLATSFQNPLHTASGQGLTNANFAQIDADAHTLLGEIGQIVGEAQQLQPSSAPLDTHAISVLASLQHALPLIHIWMGILSSLLPVLPVLLGMNAPTNYFIEVLDSTELRPGGGFVGNYGIATIERGRLSSANITDVDLLDDPFYWHGGRIPYPSQYQWFSHFLAADSWSLRDSNLDADFPMSAHYAEANYRLEGGKGTFQGVIAITPQFIEQALAIIGPISVPEYRQVVTANNLINLIHYYQLGAGTQGTGTVLAADGHSSQRKHFTSLLALHFMERIRQLPSSRWPALARLLLHELQAKDIQLYFNAPAAEQVLHQVQLDSAIQPSPGDGVMLVDANVAGDKANHYIQNVVHDQVTLDAQGNAFHRLTVQYSWTILGNVYGTHLYRDYLRVYVPTGSVLHEQEGWMPLGTSADYGYTVWSGVFVLSFGETHMLNLSWTVPAAAKHTATGWHYRYLVQRQAGIVRNWQVQFAFPHCARNAHLSSGLQPFAVDMAEWMQPLTQNTLMGVDYSC